MARSEKRYRKYNIVFSTLTMAGRRRKINLVDLERTATQSDSKKQRHGGTFKNEVSDEEYWSEIESTDSESGLEEEIDPEGSAKTKNDTFRFSTPPVSDCTSVAPFSS